MRKIAANDGYHPELTKAQNHCPKLIPLTDEDLQREYDFYMAQKMVTKMQDMGLVITRDCHKLLGEIRRYFSPIFVKILPSLLDI